MALWTSTSTGYQADTCDWPYVWRCNTAVDVTCPTNAELLASINTADGTSYMYTLNGSSDAGGVLLGIFGASNPNTGTITDIKLKVRWRKTAAGAGTFDFVSKLGANTSVANANVAPSLAWTDFTTAAFSRPGGGSWAWSDLATAKFGPACDGTSSGTVSTRVDYMEIQVTYSGTLPTAAFTVNTTTGPAPLAVSFTDQATQTPSSWAWDFGDSTFAYTQHPSHNYTATGTYTVTETATNAYGSDSEVKTSLINVQAAGGSVVCTFTGAPTTGVFPTEVLFVDGATGTPTPSSWAWDFGDGSSVVYTQHPAHVYAAAGTYTVTHTATNTATSNSVSTATRNSYIQIVDGRPQPYIDRAPASGTRPLSVQFTGTANNPATAWEWDFGDGGGAFEQNPLYVYQNAGTYNVSLWAANANGELQAYSVNCVTANYIPPSAAFTLDLGEGPEPLLVQFTNLSTGDITAYTWSFGDTQTSSVASPSHLYSSAGTYSAILTVSGTAGVSTTTATGITVVNVITGGGSYDFMSELQEQLISGVGILSPCNAFAEFGGAANVYRIVYDRTVRFVMETGILQKEATLGAPISVGVYDLPGDLIELRRVEVDGVPLRKVDQQIMDFANQTWETSTGDYIGYVCAPVGLHQVLKLAPLKSATTSVKIIYVYAPDRGEIPQTCTSDWPAFPLPGVFWWIVKYGVLADLLSNEGDLYDVQRARLCDKLYDEGVQLAKIMLEAQRG